MKKYLLTMIEHKKMLNLIHKGNKYNKERIKFGKLLGKKYGFDWKTATIWHFDRHIEAKPLKNV